MEARKALSQPIKKFGIFALHGNEPFLKRTVIQRISSSLMSDAEYSDSVFWFDGEKVAWSTIRNELDTPPLYWPCRIIAITPADPFVSRYRSHLESYALKPTPTNVLILDLKSLPESTKLAKLLNAECKISCSTLNDSELVFWLTEWAKNYLRKQLDRSASELLLELVGNDLGNLTSELTKISASVGSASKITTQDIDHLASRSRSVNVFHILENIGNDRPGEAITILEVLLHDGEDPLAILGPLASQLRKLASAWRLHVVQGLTIQEAMDAAQIPKWSKIRDNALRQMRHLAGRRLEKLPEWLAELDFGIKGGNSLPPRIQIERFVAQLAIRVSK